MPDQAGLRFAVAEFEAAAEDELRDKMIRVVGDADAETRVEFPVLAEVEIDGGDDLVFLIADCVKSVE